MWAIFFFMLWSLDFFVTDHVRNVCDSIGLDLFLNQRTQSIHCTPLGMVFNPAAGNGGPCLALEIPAHMSQSYHCIRHYIMTMSQTLTKRAWPAATTCVTAAGWKYCSAIPLLRLYFGMTKSQHSGRGQNHKTSVASHFVVLHFLTSTSPSLDHILPSRFLSKAHEQMHLLRFI